MSKNKNKTPQDTEQVKKSIDHDSFFKNILKDYGIQFLEWLFKGIVAAQGGIVKHEVLSEEMGQNFPLYGKIRADAVVKYTFAKGEVILVLFEFKSNSRQFDINKYHYYFAHLNYRFPKVPILPVVIFSDRKKPRNPPPTELKKEYFGETFLHFKYRQIYLKDYKAANYINRDSEMDRLLAFFMDRGALTLRTIFTNIINYFEKKNAFDRLLKYLHELEYNFMKEDSAGHESFQTSEKEDKMSQLFISDMIQKSMAQGMEKGMEKGIEKGRMQGIHRTAKNLRDTGISMDIISKSTGLTMEEIQRL